MANEQLIGLDLLRVGDVGATGIMGTTLTTIEHIVPDSAVLVIEPPTVTDFPVEDSDYPVVQAVQPGAKYIEFATYDMENANMLLAFGGTASSTSIWKASTSSEAIVEKSVEATSQAYGDNKMKFEIARATLAGSGDLKFAKAAPGQIGHKLTVMLPTCAGEVPLKRTKIAG